MTLRQWNVFTKVPEDLIGVYDILHISLLALVLKDGDVIGVLGSILRLLSMSNTAILLILSDIVTDCDYIIKSQVVICSGLRPICYPGRSRRRPLRIRRKQSQAL